MKKNILFVTPEVASLAKTGGLADVSAALPKALRSKQTDIRILMPAYSGLEEKTQAQYVTDLPELFPQWGAHRLLKGRLPESEVVVYLLDSPALFQREGSLYQQTNGEDWPDNPQRFALLSALSASFAETENMDGFKPDLIHLNDWQTGLTAAYLRQAENETPVVFSIHNLAYQGNFDKQLMHELGLDWSLFTHLGLEFHDMLSFLKAGIIYSNEIATVSPTYSDEITRPEFGFGMEGLLMERKEQGRLHGILNGIDQTEWNPRSDILIDSNYNGRNLVSGKKANRQHLCKKLRLPVKNKHLLVGMISRLTWQKGIDLVQSACERLCEMDAPIQFAILGSGEADLVETWQQLSQRFPDKLAFFNGYDEVLAHQIEAGSDVFAMPSRYEPCGLNQMYSLAYATPPIVNLTGGLADSVIGLESDNSNLDEATGWTLKQFETDALVQIFQQALALKSDSKSWLKLLRNAMRQNFSWKLSAKQWSALYESLIKTA